MMNVGRLSHRIRHFIGIVTIFLLLIEAGCSGASAQLPPADDPFRIEMQLSRTTVTAGQPFPVATALHNTSDRSWEIRHILPLIVVEIRADDWTEPIPKVHLPIEFVEHLEPGERYDPDTLSFLSGERMLEIAEPGVYRLVGIAQFRFPDPLTGEQKAFSVESAPVEVRVVPDDSRVAPDNGLAAPVNGLVRRTKAGQHRPAVYAGISTRNDERTSGSCRFIVDSRS